LPVWARVVEIIIKVVRNAIKPFIFCFIPL
jgi:hypothetical protein